MSDLTVPDICNVNSSVCPSESFDLTEEDDINWCTGFWNELVRENPPSLYPQSPIFSSKVYDWNDPMFVDSVFICPDVEEVLSGACLSEYPALIDNNYETRTDEDMCSVYPAANICDIVNSQQTASPVKVSKQKRKRTKKQKTTGSEQGTAPKRKLTGTKKQKSK